LRIRQHSENAIKVADFLKGHAKVSNVIFPRFQTGEARRRADTYFRNSYGALVGFELKGGRDAGRAFINALQLLYHVANIGDARSLAIHPATTTHSQLGDEEQLATGVTPGYVRLSIGLPISPRRWRRHDRAKSSTKLVDFSFRWHARLE
jgi:O-acetylhomoserine (thiol)-lyase